jgi:hypothetical protein
MRNIDERSTYCSEVISALIAERNEALAKVEYLKEYIEYPIEYGDGDYNTTRYCKYCGQNLGTTIVTSTEHISKCDKIPANKVGKDLLQDRDNKYKIIGIESAMMAINPVMGLEGKYYSETDLREYIRTLEKNRNNNET